MYVVLIETSGNQNYIFATNKLRENVGASELTYQVGTKVVLEVVGGRGYSYDRDKTGNDLRKILLDEKPIEDPSNDRSEEIVIATSGKALLLTRKEERAKQIVRDLTTRALKEMPGLTVHGAIEAVDDLSDIHEAVGRVHRKLENLRHRIPSNQQRFMRVPYVEPCASSGLPAKSIRKFEPQARAYSELTLSKRRESGKGRISNMLETVFDIELPKNLEKFEDVFPHTTWISVIHADGNGLGDLFLKFNEHLMAGRDGRKYVDAYRKFSIALDLCTVNAAGYALKNLQFEVTKAYSEGEVPVLPLVLGGDDLTFLCDGQYAPKFTRDFTEHFERETANLNRTKELTELKKDRVFAQLASRLQIEIGDERKDVIPYISSRAFGVERLGICAGVAIVKPHYPFHQAYELAEQLLKSAKQVKTRVEHKSNGKKVSLPCSAMDFHVLYDSSGVELNEIRSKLEVDDGATYLYAKPYVITEVKEKPLDAAWLNHRKWDRLADRVCAMLAAEEDDKTKRKLPNSQMHHIRESLHRGKTETDSEVGLFQHRYASNDPKLDKGFARLLCESIVSNPEGKEKKIYSLFFKEKRKIDGKEVEVHATHFLDALDVVDFWKGFDSSEDKKQAGGGHSQHGGAQ